MNLRKPRFLRAEPLTSSLEPCAPREKITPSPTVTNTTGASSLSSPTSRASLFRADLWQYAPAVGKKDSLDFIKALEDSRKAMEAMQIKLSAMPSAPARSAKRQAAIDDARELADALNEQYTVERFHPNKVTIDRGRYEAMEKVISCAMVAANTPKGTSDSTVLTARVGRLRKAIHELLMYDGDRETIIASLMKMEEALSEQDALREHS